MAAVFFFFITFVVMKPEYQGEAFSIDDILQMLRRQGLDIGDGQRAAQVLYNVSYSRLKNYLTFLMDDRKTHRFRPGATFEHAYALYGFDRRLRELIFHEMEKIEISVRTRMAYACNGKEKGYWFLNPAHFKTNRGHDRILQHVRMELQRSDNEGIRAFYDKYSNDFPPSWLTLEATSMGTLWTIYDELSDEGIRESVAGYYGMSPRTFSSWIRHLVSVRNNCAHHNRIWNNVPSNKAGLPVGLTKPFPQMGEEDRNHIYMTLCIIQYMQGSIKPTNTFACRLKSLIGNFKMIDAADMGFPKGWEDDEFWNNNNTEKID